jgi:O-antigen ligase
MSSAEAQFIVDSRDQLPLPKYSVLHSSGYLIIPLIGFMCALAYVRDDGRCMRFLHIVLGVNFAVAAACILQYVVAPQTLLWTAKHHYRAAFTGTFVNPNTAATHFGFLLVMALALSLRQLERIGPAAYTLRRHSDVERRHLRRLGAYAVATFLFLIALLLTKSRAGILASLVGVAGFVAAWVYFAFRRRTTAARALAISVISVLGVFVVFAFFGERLALRLQDQGLIEPGRLCTYASTWNAIREASWWGTGLGTFQDVFPAYRSPECGLYGHWEMAHSVFLEGGLVLGAIVPVCVLVIYFQLIKTFGAGVRDRRRFRFVPLSSLGLLIILTLHSLVDFSLQVPGFSLAAAAVLGAGAAVSLRFR